MRTVKFNKEPDMLWYIVYPEWTGEHSDLQMVSGADELLEVLALDASYNAAIKH